MRLFSATEGSNSRRKTWVQGESPPRARCFFDFASTLERSSPFVGVAVGVACTMTVGGNDGSGIEVHIKGPIGTETAVKRASWLFFANMVIFSTASVALEVCYCRLYIPRHILGVHAIFRTAAAWLAAEEESSGPRRRAGGPL